MRNTCRSCGFQWESDTQAKYCEHHSRFGKRRTAKLKAIADDMYPPEPKPEPELPDLLVKEGDLEKVKTALSGLTEQYRGLLLTGYTLAAIQASLDLICREFGLEPLIAKVSDPVRHTVSITKARKNDW
jgi:hypothetical protein